MRKRYGSVLFCMMLLLTALLMLQGCESVRKRTDREQQVSEETVAENTAEDTAGQQEPQEVQEVSAESVEEPAPEEEEIPEGEPAPVEKIEVPLPKYDDYLAINPYVAGWLRIDDTVIDDPVVYTPGSQNYFLHRDLDGSDSSKGMFFIAVDWQKWYHNTLIYGHNMKDGSGFGSLQKYAKESYGKSHPVIHFDTLFEERDYELYGVFYSQIEEDELETEEDREQADQAIEEAGIKQKEEESGGEIVVEPEELTLFDIDLSGGFGDVDIYRQEKDEDNGRFRYYYFTDLSEQTDFEYFAKSVKERSLYDTGVEAEWGDDFVTLSTCSYQVKNGRFVVVGVRKKP